MASPPSDNLDEDETSVTSSPSSSPESPFSGTVFTKFPELPPEIRYQIWRTALPHPGINFFNVHCIPNDHPGANRSTSPPWLYLDLRRLSIDDDDEAVAEYDASAWQARETLRRVCREARNICTLSQFEVANITLTRPRRGLFVRAGDGQVKRLTPFTLSDVETSTEPEPLEYRTVQVRADDVLCLSFENCSFNLPFEETAISESGGHPGTFIVEDVNDDTDELGWTYDPQLMPPLPVAIPTSRLCVGMARGGRRTLQVAGAILLSMLSFSREQPEEQMLTRLPLLMLDAYKQELGDRNIEELTPRSEVLWDRFGDPYIALPWDSTDLPADYRLVKVWPESNDIRERYLQSALLQSPKRPAAWSSLSTFTVH
ncbi:hypothetical protein M434DRAFT_399309 [Hypoxylon sp. CO27-5]|nr:hypothetical protein M434DRAFT_399309 [Hypoxylon sp. CO27-5]